MATVLIVDDEDVFRNECAEYFRRNQWQTITAADGAQAIALLDQRRGEIDAIILDRSMPGKSGDEVVQWLYEHQLLDDLCVIMLTAYSDLDSAVDTLQAGAWQYVSKPILLHNLLAFVAPGVALKKCHRMRRKILAAETLTDVVEQVRNIIRDTLAPDCCEVIFVPSSGSPEIPGYKPGAEDKRFVRELAAGKPFITASEKNSVRNLQPLLEGAGSLMAVPVADTDSAMMGVLDIESLKEKAFSIRWIEVLHYCADLIGTFQAVLDARKIKEIALLNQELRHRMATSVNIINQQVNEALRKFSADQSPDNPLTIISNHVATIDSVMDDLSEIILKDQPLQTAAVSPYDVVRKVYRGDGRIPVLGPDRPANGILVNANADALRYSLDCIVQNAFEAIEYRRKVDATPRPAGHVKLTIHEEPPWVQIAVEDTGVGFTPEIYGRLFAPLFSTKTRKGHHGIGLYSVRRMITKMGGRVDAESPGRFQGATFTISLLKA